MISDDESRLRKLNRELYTNKKEEPKARGFLHEKKIDAPDDWMTEAHDEPIVVPKIKTHSFFKKIFFASLGFLIIAIAFFGISLLFGGNTISAKNVQITITAKSFVDGGEMLPVDVSIVNRNKLPVELATLVLQYPEGNASNPDAIARIPRQVGSIGVGDTHNESFSIQLYGEEGSTKEISAHLEFRVQNGNAVYSQQGSQEVTVRSSPIRLTLDAPTSAIPNQEIPLKFTVIGNGTETLPDTAMIVQYPPGFSFTKGNPAPSLGNNIWYLGDMPAGANRTITAYGIFSGGANEAKTIRASVGSQNANNEQLLDRVYNTLAQVIPLSNAFLDARLVIDDSEENMVPVSAGEKVRVKVLWQNTLAAQLTNAEVSVSFSGSAYDPLRVQGGSGFFESANNRIVWTRQQDPKLAMLDPGASGEFTFSIEPKSIPSNAMTNPSILLAVNVGGFDSSGVKLSAETIERKTIVLNSDLNMLARTIHYSGPIQNSGPMPPKPNQETTYTLEWQLTNSRNRVADVKVSTILPIYVKWKDVQVPEIERSNVSFNAVTRELVWSVGDVPAGTGSSLAPKKVSMKIGITPSINQMQLVPELTDEIIITGRDTFTNQDITILKRAMNTQLLNDSSSVGASGQVGEE